MKMKFPNFNEEKKLWRQGFNFVAGLDEAGRGPLAGPVVAAAVVLLNPNDRFGFWNLDFGISEINDSKLLSSKKRKELYNIITTHPNIEWGIGIVSEKIIDRINILQATKLAMQKAICNANIRMHTNDTNKKIDFLLLDGNFSIRIAQPRSACGLRSGMRMRPYEYNNIPQKSIIKGDQKVISISAASIIAKVARDKIMEKYDKKYPQYGFKKHKGYPTKAHFANLEKCGPCKIHRKSFHIFSKG